VRPPSFFPKNTDRAVLRILILNFKKLHPNPFPFYLLLSHEFFCVILFLKLWTPEDYSIMKPLFAPSCFLKHFSPFPPPNFYFNMNFPSALAFACHFPFIFAPRPFCFVPRVLFKIEKPPRLRIEPEPRPNLTLGLIFRLQGS